MTVYKPLVYNPNGGWKALPSGDSIEGGQVTFETLGAPTTGAIFTGVISGTTLTTSALQSGAIAIGMTLTAAGGTGAVQSGTIITGGSGTSWTVNHSQSVSSRVMVANDSWPYIADALEQGSGGILFSGAHWFSQCINASGYPVNWFGPQGYINNYNGFPARLYFPYGYAALVATPTNFTVSAQGDVTLPGSFANGGIYGSSFSRLAFQLGNGNAPVSTSNNRPAVSLYAELNFTSNTIQGADGNGVYVFGDTTNCISDKCAVRDNLIQNCWGNGIEIAGADGNTCDIQNNIISNVGLCGIYDHSFLGNSYRANQVQGTAGVNFAPSRCIVRRSNNIYYSIQDSNTNHDPTGSSGWWQLWTASVGADTWSSGTTYMVGASYRTSGSNNRVEFLDCYAESDSPPALLQSSVGGQPLTGIFGGLFGAGIDTTNGNYYGENDGLGTARNYTASNPSGAFLATGAGGPEMVGMIISNTAANPAGMKFNSNAVNVGFIRSTGYGTGSLLYLSGYTGTGTTRKDMLVLSSNPADSGIVPGADNDLTLGSSSNRWKDVRTVLLNGVAPVIAGAYTAAPLTMATSRLLGRTTASGGAAEEISVTDGLSFTGGVLKVAPAAAQADSTAVDVPGIVADFNALLAKLRTAKFLTP